MFQAEIVASNPEVDLFQLLDPFFSELTQLIKAGASASDLFGKFQLLGRLINKLISAAYLSTIDDMDYFDRINHSK